MHEKQVHLGWDVGKKRKGKKTFDLEKNVALGREKVHRLSQKKRLKHLLKPVSGTGGSVVFVMIKSGPTTTEPLMLQLA